MTDPQEASFKRLLHLFEWHTFHHGDCVGADTQAHHVAVARKMTVVVHPPDNNSKRAWVYADITREPRPYLDRNHDIVDETSYLIATPGEDAEQQMRSGTWATVRYAHRIGRWYWLVLPSGEIVGRAP